MEAPADHPKQTMLGLKKLMSTASAVKNKLDTSARTPDTVSGWEANYIPQRAKASPGDNGPDESDRIVKELMKILEPMEIR